MKKSKNQIMGLRACMEAINSGKEFDKILVKKGLKGELFQELFKTVRDRNIPFQYVPIEKLNRINSGNHQGVIGFVSPITFQNIEQLIPFIFEQGKMPFVLILDRITDVRNFGAIARTAECAGVNAIVFPSKGAAQIGSDAIKTSAGALNHIPVCRVNNLQECIQFFFFFGIKIIAATEKAADLYTKVEYSGPIAIVMGSEEDGISDTIIRISDELVKIPILGNVESLNVSVAAGVIMYEALKSRN